MREMIVQLSDRSRVRDFPSTHRAASGQSSLRSNAMNVVAENHADSLGCFRDRSRDGLVAAVIGDVLRDNIDTEGNAMPERLLALLDRLDGAQPDSAAS
ncbi:hypothetical protein KHHGKMAE_0758 [Methylobacterium persicinum]|nr:hypothetical protein KHHGKMAE_0758 [Methylobacterium persicinum]